VSVVGTDLLNMLTLNSGSSNHMKPTSCRKMVVNKSSNSQQMWGVFWMYCTTDFSVCSSIKPLL